MNGNPSVQSAQLYPSETSLQTALVTLLNSNGWTTYGPPGSGATNTGVATLPPAGAGVVTVWATSRGADRTHHIVVGIYANDTTRQLRIYGGADLDRLGTLVPAAGGSIAGYVNNDTTMVLTNPPASAPLMLNALPGGTSSGWLFRTTGTSYRAFFSANPNGFSLLCTYQSGAGSGLKTHGTYACWVPVPSGRRNLCFARARVASMSIVPGTGAAGSGATYEVYLDRNINRWLKDGTQFAAEATGTSAVSELLFQAVIGDPSHAAETDDAKDISMVERIPIVAGSLRTRGSAPNSKTVFRISCASGVGRKLARPGGRYDPVSGIRRGSAEVNGIGDIVSVMAEPTLYYCCSRAATGSANLELTSEMSCIGAWHPHGGQIATGDITAASSSRLAYMLRNSSSGDNITPDSTPVADNDPSPAVNRSPAFVAHCFPTTNFDTVPVIPDTDQRKFDSVGVWPDFRFFPVEAGARNEAVGTVKGDPTQKYKIQEHFGGPQTLSTFLGSGGTSAALYVNGIRGRWA